MKPSLPNPLLSDFAPSRRVFLQAAGGFGGLALSTLLASESCGALHHAAKAKRVIQIFCPGGMSQIDTFDYKPALEKRWPAV